MKNTLATIHNIANKGFSGNSSILSHSKFRVGGQESSPLQRNPFGTIPFRPYCQTLCSTLNQTIVKKEHTMTPNITKPNKQPTI